MFVRAVDGSQIFMDASEVKRLALSSLADIKQKRAKLLDLALKAAEPQRCVHWWGLWSHPKYRTKEIAMEHAPEVQMAQNFATTDEHTCKTLLKAAQYLLDDESRSDEEKVICVSLTDFRALT